MSGLDLQDQSESITTTEQLFQRLSRRRLIVGSSVTLAAAGLASIGSATGHALQETPVPAATPGAQATPMASPVASQVTGMPALEVERPAAFFNVHEAQTVDALVSRLLPGTADDPGAHEAGVVFYIDRTLSGPNLGYDLKTYKQGPFLISEEEPVPVEMASTTDIYRTVLVAQEEAPRYGFQSILSPQEIYRRGIGFVDTYAQHQFKKTFVALSPEQQDAILTDMEADKAAGFEGPSARAFFTQLRNDTIEGMFSDPMYGGNRNLVGWLLIGYPGALPSYAPDDITNPTYSHAPQSLATMMANAGQ
jgi:gluconate 2-dehydrogenase gamma chain